MQTKASSPISASGSKYDKSGLPTVMRIFKVGNNKDVRGLNAIYDPKDAQTIQSANNRTTGRIPFDVGHGMTNANAPPESHQSWGTGKLVCNSNGVWLTNIKWDPVMRKRLLLKRYEYISPTFYVDPVELKKSKGKSARITRLLTVSLTNVPATDNISPIMQDDCIRRSLVAFSRPMIVKDMAKNAPAVKRDDDEKNKDEKDPIVRDDDEDPDGAPPSSKDGGPPDDDDKNEGDDEPTEEEGGEEDLENVDLDGKNPAELKKLCARLLDMVAAMKKESVKGSEEEEEEEEEEKRSIVNQLHADCLISFTDKKQLKAMSLKDLIKHERGLRRDPTVTKASATVASNKSKAERKRGLNPVIHALSLQAPRIGATDEEIAAHVARCGTDPATIERLGLNEQTGKVWGTNVKKITQIAGKN